MADIHQAREEVESSAAFEKFRKTHPDHYLVHVFCNHKIGESIVELGYYGPDHEITVFTTNPVSMRAPEGAFQREKHTIPELDLPKAQLGVAEVLEIAHAHQTRNHPAHPVLQRICVLQENDGPLWTITLITMTFQMLLLRIDAITGEIRSAELRSLLDLGVDERDSTEQ